MRIEEMGQRITQLRKSSGMTQSKLAQKLEISDRTVSKWESGAGAPPTVILPQLAKLLQTNLSALM